MVLTLEAVSYRYAGAARPSLREVSATFADGRVVGIAGRSEAGKTTLCLVAGGIAPRTIAGTLTGRVLLDGQETAPLAMHELVGRIGIGFSSPTTQLSGVAGTVYEEVAFGPMNLGLPRAEIIERTESAMAALRIDALAERDPARLSGGQQQLVGIAGLLAMRPAHLVLDEPTAHLDPAGTRLVGEALARLAADGASIAIAEQKTDVLQAICDDIIIISDGQVAIDGPASTVFADPRLVELGVAPPATIRLERAALAASLPDVVVRRLREATTS
jgi:energy-coupling factor transport system ATP-binding protein